MRRVLSVVASACLWLGLLALMIVGVVRVGADAKERRPPSDASHSDIH